MKGKAKWLNPLRLIPRSLGVTLPCQPPMSFSRAEQCPATIVVSFALPHQDPHDLFHTLALSPITWLFLADRRHCYPSLSDSLLYPSPSENRMLAALRRRRVTARFNHGLSRGENHVFVTIYDA